MKIAKASAKKTAAKTAKTTTAKKAPAKKTACKKCCKAEKKTCDKVCAKSSKKEERFMPLEDFVKEAFSKAECKKMAQEQLVKTAMRLLKTDEKSAKAIAAKITVDFAKITIGVKA